jgi:hypothetical protein
MPERKEIDPTSLTTTPPQVSSWVSQELLKMSTTTILIFNEANITIPQAARTHASQALINLGYRQDDKKWMVNRSPKPHQLHEYNYDYPMQKY